MEYTETEYQDAIKVDHVFEAIRSGELDQARALAEDVMLRAPRPEDYESWSEEDGVLYLRYWDDPEREFFSTAFAETENPPEVVWLLSAYGRACYALGFLAVQAGDQESAIRLLNAASDYEPEQPRPIIEVALLAARGGHNEAALEIYNAAMGSRPIQPPSIVALIMRGKGFALTELGRLDEAIGLFEESLVLEPSNELALGEIRYIVGLKSGEDPVSGATIVTGREGDVGLPVLSNPVMQLIDELTELNGDGVITAEELERTRRRLLEEPHDRNAMEIIRCKAMLRALPGLARSVETGRMSAEDFEEEKASFLESLCTPLLL